MKRMTNKFNEDDDEEEMNQNSNTSLLKKNDDDQQQQQQNIPFCGCLSVKFYQPYFDLDTQDVFNRIWSTLFFCRRSETFLDSLLLKPADAYGPFWITTSLIFTVAVSSNISSWLFTWIKGTNNWVYDFQNVVTLASIVYGFAICGPGSIWLLFRQIEAPVNVINLFCLYGYSLFIYIPAAIICLFPSQWIHWLILLAASFSSGAFLIRNLFPSLSSNARQHASIVLGLIGILQLAFVLSIKILYF